MLTLEIENQLVGPLSVPGVKHRLIEIADKSTSLAEAAHQINSLPGLACYYGSYHVAVHRGRAGLIEAGFERLALLKC